MFGYSINGPMQLQYGSKLKADDATNSPIYKMATVFDALIWFDGLVLLVLFRL